MTMFGISGEHLLILGIVLLIFGPKRLPELGNTLGKAIKNFKDAVSGVEEAQFRRIEDQKAHQPPFQTQGQAAVNATAPGVMATQPATATTQSAPVVPSQVAETIPNTPTQARAPEAAPTPSVSV